MPADPKPAADQSVVFGLLALALAVFDVLVIASAVVFSHTGWRSSDLAEPLNRVIFSYGLVLDVLAVAFALGAIRFGKRGRPLGVVAIAFVALGFVLMLFT